MTSETTPIGFADNMPETLGISHGFFTRKGGVSTGIYKSLNTGEGSDDDPANVRENRKRVAALLGTKRRNLLSLHQIHSNKAVFVEKPWHHSQPKADAMVTKTPGLVLSALSADCAPVLFVDPDARIIGAAHAGWRGALSGITDATVEMMLRHGAKAKNIYAAVGPCLGPFHFEVGPEFVAAFLGQDAENKRFFKPDRNDKAWFDIKSYLRARLSHAGINHIFIHPHCTYERQDLYFSYRRNTHQGISDYGRNISAIMLKKVHDD